MMETEDVWGEAPLRGSQGDKDSNFVPDSDSLSGLGIESLDPHKRELLEARLMGRGLAASPDSNMSNASSVGEDDSDKERARSNRPRKRVHSDVETSRKSGKRSPRVDPSKKISEYFPFRSSSSTSVHPSSGVASQLQFENSLSSSSSSHSVSSQTDITLEELHQLELQKAQQNELCVLKERMVEVDQMLQSYKDRYDLATSRLTKSMEVIRDLLTEKSVSVKKCQREESIKNQLRLGRFQTQRQGAQFVESWMDGFAFEELAQQQEAISQQKEELEKQRKLLAKKRVTAASGSSGAKGRGGKLPSPTSQDGDNFAKPHLPTMTPSEYHERDEMLKLRAAALKKEDANLQAELEKLEKERNLHIRELKRITAEDSSRFNHNPTLHNRYLLLHLLGKGGFSEVYKAFDLQEQRYVACKIHQLKSEWQEDKKANYIKHALREYNIHKKLDHPHIVKLFDVFEIDTNSFCTVLELVSGNDLDFLLKQNKSMPEREARSIVMQTLSALRYLNEIKPPIIHYDLKPGNILLGSGVYSYEAKITDFGLSKIVEQDHPDGMELTSQGAGTYWYLPPECFVIGKEPPKISSKVDVWSIGVILFQSIYGKKPFGHNLSQASILEQHTMLNAREVEFPVKPQVSVEAKQFMKRCLTYQKEYRPDILTLCEDPFLKPKKLLSSAATPSAAPITVSTLPSQ